MSSNTSSPTFTYTPALGIGSTWTYPADRMVMLDVPKGEFRMGNNSSGLDENPVHTVYLDAYWIDKTEVPNAMYAKCVTSEVSRPSPNNSSLTHSSYYTDSQFANYPVIYVDWNKANAYCQWAGARLPSEVEWEKAAHGTDERAYPWGDSFNETLVIFCDKNCIFDWADKNFDDGYIDTSPVGSYPYWASPYGVLDMAGNVWEWVNDWYGKTYYIQSPANNPLGPSTGDSRVLRGGSWLNYAKIIRSSYRTEYGPTNFYVNFGFRCARSFP